jgi:hypothetical protein
MPGRPPRRRPSRSLAEGVDHLVYAAPRLEDGMEAVARLLGVRPVLGGRHPGFGTHNALVALGPTTYLEVIAPDPGLPPPDRGVLFFDDDGHETARLATWAARSEAIEEAVTALKAAGFDLADIQAGSRETPDGALLSWRLTDPWAPRLGGAIPFLIAWGGTPHPARSAPPAGQLVGMCIEHPEPERVGRALAVLGLETDVRCAERFRLVATIETARGEVELT